jgi:hypothetical protein
VVRGREYLGRPPSFRLSLPCSLSFIQTVFLASDQQPLPSSMAIPHPAALYADHEKGVLLQHLLIRCPGFTFSADLLTPSWRCRRSGNAINEYA